MPEETVADEKVRLVMVPVDGSRIELLEPTEKDSPIGRFLEKRGEGLHHVALQVEDIAGTVERLKAAGTRFISDEIKVGAGGHLTYSSIPPARVEFCSNSAPIRRLESDRSHGPSHHRYLRQERAPSDLHAGTTRERGSSRKPLLPDSSTRQS